MEKRWHAHPTLDGVAQRYIDDEGHIYHRQKVQDVEPIINRNAELAKEDGFDAERRRRHVGRVPATVYYDWIAEFERQGLIGPGNMSGLNDLLLKKLRDSDYSKFKTCSGSI